VARDIDPREHPDTSRLPREAAARPNLGAPDLAGLRKTIDRLAQDRPALSELGRRLEAAGVRLVPSIQASGRLNGLSYEVAGVRVKGSLLGRPYTAYGLQRRKGVSYDPSRDDAYLATRASRDRAPQDVTPPTPDVREPDRARQRAREIPSEGERQTLREIGRFRTVAAADLVHLRYQGDDAAWRRDRRRLASGGLLECRSVVVKGPGQRLRTLSVVALTRRGKQLLRRLEKDPDRKSQALYAGFVKPKEIAHDAAIYRLYYTEAAKIERAGGKVRRVVLDYELKKRIYAPLAKARKESALAYTRKQAEVAKANGLKVVDGKIPLPDLRIEYETARGERTWVDLELATENYRGDHLAGKERAGFKLYGEGRVRWGGSSGRYAAGREHLLEEILSF